MADKFIVRPVICCEECQECLMWLSAVRLLAHSRGECSRSGRYYRPIEFELEAVAIDEPPFFGSLLKGKNV